MTMIDETRPITPEPPHIEVDVLTMFGVTDVDSTVETTILEVTAERSMTEAAHVHVVERSVDVNLHRVLRAILRLRPHEARRLAQALDIAATEAEKLDSVDMGGAR